MTFMVICPNFRIPLLSSLSIYIQNSSNPLLLWTSDFYVIRSFLQVDFCFRYQLINLVWFSFDFFSFTFFFLGLLFLKFLLFFMIFHNYSCFCSIFFLFPIIQQRSIITEIGVIIQQKVIKKEVPVLMLFLSTVSQKSRD